MGTLRRWEVKWFAEGHTLLVVAPRLIPHSQDPEPVSTIAFQTESSFFTPKTGDSHLVSPFPLPLCIAYVHRRLILMSAPCSAIWLRQAKAIMSSWVPYKKSSWQVSLLLRVMPATGFLGKDSNFCFRVLCSTLIPIPDSKIFTWNSRLPSPQLLDTLWWPRWVGWERWVGGRSRKKGIYVYT